MKTHSIIAAMLLALGAALVPPARGQAVGPARVEGARTPAVAESRRVPAEWEPQEAIWMQWPPLFERSYRENFSGIIDAIQAYEPVHLLVKSVWARDQAQAFLAGRGVPLSNITWEIVPYDASWMRDNGPVWVRVNGCPVVQDWGFDAWGGLYPPWDRDDAVPTRVAAIEGVSCEPFDMINERGTLEFNGAGTLITSGSVLSDRNPGMSRAEMEARLKAAFGVTRIVWLLHGPSDDLTKGHVDAIARFIDAGTVVVGRCVDPLAPDAWVFEEAASIVAEAGFDVIRLDIPGEVTYRNVPMSANYLNWLVANGVVVVCGFGRPDWDEAARQAIAGFFPGRDVVVTETLELWYWGGGVHCVTNDQPAMRLP